MRLPPKLVEEDIFPLLPDLWKEGGALELDFSHVEFAAPFGALVLASEVQSVRRTRLAGTCRVTGVDLGVPAHSYLAHAGFFQVCGHDVGNQPGEADAKKTFIPVTELRRGAPRS